VMTQKPTRASTPLRKATPTKVAARGSEEKLTSTTAEPVVSVTDAISETTQQPKASAQAQEASVSEVAAVEPVIPAAAEPVVSVTDASSETITAKPDPAAAVTAEVAKPFTATKKAKPDSMQGMEIMIKSTEDFVAFGQANVEAFVKSSQIWAAGVQELTKLFAATTKASFDESVSTFKAIAAAKSVTEALDLQSAFANGVVAKTLAESNKLIDASIKLTEQTLAPISARVTGAVETFSKAA